MIKIYFNFLLAYNYMRAKSKIWSSQFEAKLELIQINFVLHMINK